MLTEWERGQWLRLLERIADYDWWTLAVDVLLWGAGAWLVLVLVANLIVRKRAKRERW
jgi:hypothetical protein